MSEKIGESNIIELFKHILLDKVSNKEKKVDFIESTMCGKDDRKFADYFANLNSINILIEFKEFEKNIKSEKDKPLRKKLCEEIGRFIAITRRGHFIAWSKNKDNNSREIFLDNYIFKVSNIFELVLHGVKKTEYKCEKFIDLFLEQRVGLGLRSFTNYIKFLKKLYGDDPDDGTSFDAILLSYYNGRLLANKIRNGDLLVLINLIKDENKKSMRYLIKTREKNNSKKPKPKGSGTSSLIRTFSKEKSSAKDKKVKLLIR